MDKLLERNVIEVAPLAFMRGRTLSDAFIIMDEAQNTTNEQMKMFVTRLGNGSKAVITGDLTQIDLPNPKKSGLFEALHVLEGVEGIRFCHFEDVDVVRHQPGAADRARIRQLRPRTAADAARTGCIRAWVWNGECRGYGRWPEADFEATVRKLCRWQSRLSLHFVKVRAEKL